MARLPGMVGRLGANAARATRLGVAWFALPRGRFWLRLRLASPLPELASPVLFAREPVLAFVEVLQILDAASRDPRVAGVVVRLEGPPGGLARAQALRRALAAVRGAGRPVVAWSERLGAEELLVASGASRVFLPESGAVFLVGLRLSSFFLRGLLERAGVRADVVRVGDYKSAAELLTREGMSRESREQLEALADDLFAALLAEVAEGRGLPLERVRECVDRGPHGAAAARELGLIDGCLYPDELEGELLRLAPDVGEPDRVPLVDGPAYLSVRARDPGWRPLLRELPRVAYVVASGAIHTGRGLRGVAADTYRALLERLRADDRVRGVVVRVESPGGDAVASDLLWRALRRVGERKPVVASLGDVAASGGYFLAAGAGSVVAESATLTGSIGVVGGKLDVSRLYERLGVGKDAVERGARAGMLAEERGFTPDERKAVREEMQALYELFLARVGEGRALSREAVHAAGGGRVWSGARARELGLVDALGGPLEALGELRRRAGIEAAEPWLVELHPRLPRLLHLRSWLRPWRLEGL
jgi:protease-4